MNSADLEKYFETLEITKDASFTEMKNSYIHLRNLYSKNNLSISPLIESLSKKKQKHIVREIDEAFRMLEQYYQDKKIENIRTKREKIQKSRVPTFEVIGGEALKMIRKVLGIELEEIAFLSGVQLKHLTNIELERYDLLPPDIYVKTFLRKYASQLSLDSDKVIADYFKRMKDFKSESD
ncbi:MAG: helix-turn-helix domain-containing protein [Acidobacteriota bacterium]